MRITVALALIVGSLVVASGVMAQEERRWQEISVQGTGLFTMNTNGNGISQQATDTGGFLVSYRYRFSEWAAADASYGYARNKEQNFSSAGAVNVESDVHEFTGALVLTVPYRVFQFRPYVLAGSGTLDFRPRNNRGAYVSGARAQARPVFLYGAGADYDLTKHLMVRLEYRGFVYQPPDFQMLTFNSGGTTHMAQPSAGIVYRF